MSDPSGREPCPQLCAHEHGFSGEWSGLLEEVVHFQNELFPDSTPDSLTAHLLEEAHELSEAPRNPEEMADVALLLLGLASRCGVDLPAWMRRKMEICRLRSWGPSPCGAYLKHRGEMVQGGPLPRLHLLPAASARLAAAAAGEVVEVRCGVGPLPEIPDGYEWCVQEDGEPTLLGILSSKMERALPEELPGRPWVLDEPQLPHPSPAVGTEVWVPYPYELSEWLDRLHATVTALGVRQYDCESCAVEGVDAWNGALYASDDCPNCQGSPPWWSTIRLRRGGTLTSPKHRGASGDG